MAVSRIAKIFILFQAYNSLSSCFECSKEFVETHDCLRSCEYPAQPRVCEYVFSAKWFYSMSSYCFDCPVRLDDCYLEECVALDGSARPVVVTNSTIPGPSIQVCEGDTVRVKLVNNLQNHGALTIHWYGMYQEGTNWMDGASMITQCPVVSSSSFTYEFKADPAGTHWWHAHSGYQRDDGMYGSLIVRQAREVEHNGYAYDFDLPEHVMMLADWKSRPALSTFLMTESPTRYVISEEQTFSILVNGRASEVEFFDEDGNAFFTPLSTFEVEEGMTYRFRVISAIFALCNLQVSIESHPLTIIAVDGSEVRPKEVDSFVIAPGERYDFLLKATAKPSSYCIYAIGTSSTECVDDGAAILQYKTGSYATPKCQPGPPVPESLTDTPIFSIIEAHAIANQPTSQPTNQPTNQPTSQPANQPTNQPTSQPANQPTNQPTNQPANQPTSQPTNQPTNQPTSQPANQPTNQPTSQPANQPTNQPTNQPANQPTSQPTNQPTNQPTSQPANQPTNQPTSQPANQPTNQPTNQPANQPTSQPTNQPTNQPTSQPANQPTITRSGS
ncbi:laccase-2-like [Anneissia japonica]|uniref:laccase-2-like n=1 Tax=Anneissia japonica TaxID=1529436 RepID=UPI0014255907|nr:laccase-2-like [Anneissia japonica]